MSQRSLRHFATLTRSGRVVSWPPSTRRLFAALALGCLGAASAPLSAQPRVVPADQTLLGNAGTGLGDLISGDGPLVLLGGPAADTFFATWDPAALEWSFEIFHQIGALSFEVSGSRVALYPGGSSVEIHTYTPPFWSFTGVVAPPELPATVTFAGEWVAAGVPVGPGGPGVVYIFREVGGSWTLDATLTSTDPAERYGAALDFRDDALVLAVGAPGDGSGGTGRVERWVRSGVNWILLGDVTAPSSQPDNFFGSSIALGADTLVVGAPGEDRGFVPFLEPDAGAVFLYKTDLGLDLLATFRGDSADDRLGTSVDVSGEVAIAGAPGVDFGVSPTATLTDVGHAEVYWRVAPEIWQHRALLFGGTVLPEPFAEAGTAVALVGDTALVGAPKADGGGPDKGAVYSYLGAIPIFLDGFETGSTSAWSATTP